MNCVAPEISTGSFCAQRRCVDVWEKNVPAYVSRLRAVTGCNSAAFVDSVGPTMERVVEVLSRVSRPGRKNFAVLGLRARVASSRKNCLCFDNAVRNKITVGPALKAVP
ncbi:hypothetical protein GUJ93_ZPchr0010g10837 [Zizania palustris]|uniref:Uncharacterized protein n=1 Tax=Zizania palustris TaxID=103762 RepID=A0A8J6BNZ8_ZIZPA|nr:hypothetical protein GUJ93_ZPchr0010g10837 [Zizania palustris]